MHIQDPAQLTAFINAMIAATATIGGITFALLNFLYGTYIQRRQEYESEKKTLGRSRRALLYGRLSNLRVNVNMIRVTAYVFFIGLTLTVVSYFGHLLDPFYAGLSLIALLVIGVIMFLYIHAAFFGTELPDP